MSSQKPPGEVAVLSQLEVRPLVDLTDQIVRDSALQVAGGAFGDVYKCRCSDTSGSSNWVAVKALRYFVSEDPEERRKQLELDNKLLRKELGLLRRLEHPNIVPLLGVTRGFGPSLASVSPWMLNGTLHSFLKNKGQTLTTAERLRLVHGTASGLEYLHSFPVFHGDFHSSNVLVDGEHNPRICDFGLSSAIGRLQLGQTYLQPSSGTNNPGAVRWAAPELLSGSKPHTSGDIYSFGCVMFEVLSGDIPWKEMTAYQVVVLKLGAHKPPARPVSTGTVVEDRHWALMVKCWLVAQERPTAHEVVTEVQKFLSTDPRPLDKQGGDIRDAKRTLVADSPAPERSERPTSLSVPGGANGRPVGLQKGGEIDVLFLGRTGVGKSSLINMIMGVPNDSAGAAQVAESLYPCTTQSTTYGFSLSTDPRRQLWLWDTRGIDEDGGGNRTFTAKLVDRIRRQAFPSQARELKEALTRLATPILVWCIDATKIDVEIHWQLFHKVYVEYCERRVTPVVVVNRGPPRAVDWELICMHQLRRHDLEHARLLMVRKYDDSSSIEYMEDSKALRDFISRLATRSLLT